MNEEIKRRLQLVSLQDAAELLGISIRGVYRLFGSKDLPCITVGGSKRVRLLDLEAYIDRQASCKGVTL